MEKEKVLPGGRTLEMWEKGPEEWKNRIFSRYMNSVGWYGTRALLALAANGFLDIKYSNLVQDSSVLLQFHKANASFYEDGDIVWKDNLYPEDISIIHKVPNDHPLQTFLPSIKNKFAEEYSNLGESPRIESILMLSELLILAGEEKLIQNYRYFHRCLGRIRAIENWGSFVMEFLDIKKGRILELNPSRGVLSFSLDLSNTTYTANVRTREEFELINIFFLSDKEFSPHYEKGRIRVLNDDLPDLLKRNECYDFILCVRKENKTWSWKNGRKLEYIKSLLSTNGKALVSIRTDQIREIDLSLYPITTIILFGGWGKECLVLIDNNKEEFSPIKVYDRAEWANPTPQELLNSIRNQEGLYLCSVEDIERMGGHLDVDTLKRKQIKIDIPIGYKLVRLSEIAVQEHLHEAPLEDSKFLEFDEEEIFNPLTPYVSAARGKYEVDILDDDSFLINKKLLVVDCSRYSKFKFFIFDPSEGEAVVNHSKCFIIDEEKINIDYLVYQMNQEYFLKQLFPFHDSKVNNIDAKDILSCQILVPDEESSIERQKQFIEDLRQIEIAKIARRYGFDLGKFVQYEATDLPKGTILCEGKYTILEDRAISHGGFGKVYKARNEETGEVVAIKEFFYHNRQVRDPETNQVKAKFADLEAINLAKEKFRREIEKIQECAHDNIVKVYEEFEENNTCYYSMEYIDGKSLENYRSLEERNALAIIRQVAEALKAMHEKRYNHSDVKPQNILLDRNGLATLIDFGGAYHYDEEEGLSISGNSIPMQIKTPGYTPDLADKVTGFHAGRDIYSLGATLYYMLTGNEPATIDNKAKPAKISSKSWRAICSAVEEDPRKWLRSMDEFLALLPGDEEVGDMDVPEPTKNLRITPRPVVELKNDEVLVFGSNKAGHHSGGAAKQALKWGAKWYVASGPMGQTYGIPTVGVHGLDEIERHVQQFITYVEGNDHITFYVTAIGCGSAGFTPEQIAPLFKDCIDMVNVYLPESFWQVLMNKGFIKAEEYKVVHNDNHAKDRGMQDGGDKKCNEATNKEQESKEKRKGLFGRLVTEIEKEIDAFLSPG